MTTNVTMRFAWHEGHSSAQNIKGGGYFTRVFIEPLHLAAAIDNTIPPNNPQQLAFCPVEDLHHHEINEIVCSYEEAIKQKFCLELSENGKKAHYITVTNVQHLLQPGGNYDITISGLNCVVQPRKKPSNCVVL